MACELEVAKTCFVAADGDDDDDDDCNGKVLGLKLEYTGAGCGALTNPQSGKAGCAGGSNGLEPVSVRVTNDRGDKVYGNSPVVLLGDVIEATAANAAQKEFGSQTDVTIDDGLEEITFHTSCSQPLKVGDQFGSVRLVELTTTGGGTVTLPDPIPDPGAGAKLCTIPPPPPPPHCNGKVQVLSLRYVGGSCAESNQPQGGKATCNGMAGLLQPVRVVCNKDGAPATKYLDSGVPASVLLGQQVDVAAANAGATELASQTDCTIYDEFGNWLQDISLHTSCSQSLNLGDRFGALEVIGLDTTGGGSIGFGHEVIYTYSVTNHSDLPVVDVTVTDDQIGPVPGSPIPLIGPGESVILQAVAMVETDTTNIVTVGAALENGGECPDVSDFAQVTVEEPPEGPQECTSAIKALRLRYTGPDVAGPVTLSITARSGGSPAVYDFPGGLANGTVVTSPAENDFTIDAAARGLASLGTKTTLTINGVAEVVHTSCSAPVVVGQPAPLDSPKGDPSPNWLVLGFTQK